jgi:DNA-binding beta-propeller fold protein YncE
LGGAGAISKLAPDGTLSALAGRPSLPGLVDGSGAAARFGTIRALQLDLAGNLYVAENQQGLPGTTLRKVTPAGVVSTFAQLDDVLALSMAIDPAGNLYLPDWSSGLIRKLSPAGVLSTLAGVPGALGDNDGPAGVARFLSPRAIAYDPAGKLYVVDNGSHLLREVALDGTVTTVAGTRGSYGLGPDGALPGSLPTAHAIASVAPKVLLIATESGVVEIALP